MYGVEHLSCEKADGLSCMWQRGSFSWVSETNAIAREVKQFSVLRVFRRSVFLWQCGPARALYWKLLRYYKIPLYRIPRRGQRWKSCSANTVVKGRALISRTKFQSESKMKCSLKSVKGEKENRDLNNVKLIQVLMSRLFTFLDLFWALPKNLYAFIALWLHYLLIRFFVSRVRWLSSVSSLRPPSKVMFCCLAITDLCVGLIF